MWKHFGSSSKWFLTGTINSNNYRTLLPIMQQRLYHRNTCFLFSDPKEKSIATLFNEYSSKFDRLLSKYKQKSPKQASEKKKKSTSRKSEKDSSISEIGFTKKPKTKREQILQERHIQEFAASKYVDDKLTKLFPSMVIDRKGSGSNSKENMEEKRLNEEEMVESLVQQLFNISSQEASRIVELSDMEKMEDYYRKEKMDHNKENIAHNNNNELLVDSKFLDSLFDVNDDKDTFGEFLGENVTFEGDDSVETNEIVSKVKETIRKVPVDSNLTQSPQPNIAKTLAEIIENDNSLTETQYSQFMKEMVNKHFQKKPVVEDYIKQNTIELANPDKEIDSEIIGGVTPNYSLYEKEESSDNLDYGSHFVEEGIDQTDSRIPRQSVDSLGYQYIDPDHEINQPFLGVSADRVVNKKPATAKSEIDLILGELETEEEIELMRTDRPLLEFDEDEPMSTFAIQGEAGFNPSRYEKLNRDDLQSLFENDNEMEEEQEDLRVERDDEDERYESILEEGYVSLQNFQIKEAKRFTKAVNMHDEEEKYFQDLMDQYSEEEEDSKKQHISSQ
jgi:hypothetical protein